MGSKNMKIALSGEERVFMIKHYYQSGSIKKFRNDFLLEFLECYSTSQESNTGFSLKI